MASIIHFGKYTTAGSAVSYKQVLYRSPWPLGSHEFSKNIYYGIKQMLG